LEGLAMEDVGIFMANLNLSILCKAKWYILHTAIWHKSWSFGIFFPVLVCCTEKNLATLIGRLHALANLL
jgi:hypothetical protein